MKITIFSFVIKGIFLKLVKDLLYKVEIVFLVCIIQDIILMHNDKYVKCLNQHFVYITFKTHGSICKCK